MDDPDDVVEQGSQRPRRRGLGVTLAVVLVALGLFAVVRLGDDGEPDRTARTAAPSSSPTPSDSPWPTTPGACGMDVPVPMVSTAPLDERTGMRVLAGGRRPVLADVDSGDVQRLGRLPDGVQVYQLAQDETTTYLIGRTCDGPKTWLLRVDDGELHRVRFGGPADNVVAGAAGVWGVDYPKDFGRVRLRDTSGDVVRLPKGVAPYGVYADGLVGTVRPDDATAGELPELVLIDPGTGEVTRRIGQGRPLAVGDDVLVWGGPGCELSRSVQPDPARRCVLRSTPLTGGGDDTHYPLPRRQIPALTGANTLSGDQRSLAFAVNGRTHEPHIEGEHPMPPAQVAVLDLATKELDIAPDLVTAPKTRVGMALSDTGDWLVTSTNRGDHGHLLVWRVGSDELQRSPVRLAGPLFAAPPLLPAG